MVEENPYDPPPPEWEEPQRLGSAWGLYKGIGTVGGGIALLATTWFTWTKGGVAFAATLGGGVSFLLIGAIMLFYYFDDNR